MGDRADIAVVGGGAAGLAAAVFAAEEGGRGLRVIVLDGARAVGAKILVSGGGRCNVTNARVEAGDYNGSRHIVRNVLAAFDERATVRWFVQMGVSLKQEPTGKLFPVSDSARSVLSALLNRCGELGVEVRTAHRVGAVTRADNTFLIRHEQGELEARRVILATGGRSLPRTGSDGQGWEMARQLGHTVTDTHPALVPLVLNGSFFHSELSGLSQEVELSVFAGGELIDRRRGSLLWTHFGVSGPVVLDASRHWVLAAAREGKPTLKCSLLPGKGFEAVERWLVDAASSRPRLAIATILAQELPGRLSERLARHVGIDAAAGAGQVSRDQRRALVHALTALVLPVVRDRGWNYAEVTAGGVPLAEIDYRTLESRKVQGLYLVGEMLDCDGRIGGFNFQWAWATGHIAGRAAARALRAEEAGCS